jgi:hypothetical protein
MKSKIVNIVFIFLIISSIAVGCKVQNDVGNVIKNNPPETQIFGKWEWIKSSYDGFFPFDLYPEKNQKIIREYLADTTVLYTLNGDILSRHKIKINYDTLFSTSLDGGILLYKFKIKKDTLRCYKASLPFQITYPYFEIFKRIY